MKLAWTATLSIAGIFLWAFITKVSGSGGGNVAVRLGFLKKHFSGGGWRSRGSVGDLDTKGISSNTTVAVKLFQKFAKEATFGAGVDIGSNITRKV